MRVPYRVRFLAKAVPRILERRKKGALIVLCSGLTCIFTVIFVLSLGSSRVFPASSTSTYSKLIVKNCARRVTVGGVTTKTKVPFIGVEYLSWAPLPRQSFHINKHTVPLNVMRAFKRPATLLDIGANVGGVTFPTLALPQGHMVIAVEPVKKNMDILCKTASLNNHMKYPNLILVQAAISDEESTFRIFVPDGREDNSAMSPAAANAYVPNKQRAEKVRTITGDSFLRATGLYPDVIKIDVQGFELPVLSGLIGFLREAKNTLVVA